MANTPPKVLLAELTQKHPHILYVEGLLLSELGYDVTVLYWRRSFDPDLIRTLGERVNLVEAQNIDPWRDLVRLWREHRRLPYDYAIFNTVEANARHLLFALLFPHQTRFILHDQPDVLRQNMDATQRMLHRLLLRKAATVYVLSPKIYAYRRAHSPNWLAQKLAYFLPTFYPDFTDDSDERPLDSDGRIVFAVPGLFDPRLRNYRSVMAALEQIAASPLAERILIDIMGEIFTDIQGVSREFVLQAMECGLLGSTIRLQEDRFEPFDIYAARLNRSHFMLPLIDKAVLQHRAYNQYVVSMNLLISRGFAMPLVCSRDFDLDDDLRPFAVWYEGQDVFQGLQAAVELYDSPRYTQLRRELREHTLTLRAESQAALAL
ncbi:MAG: hypothetical protein GYB65_07380 [Chloroflexi bacterium]|nr:hypothetical protein [Chloroflexota bacterium]